MTGRKKKKRRLRKLRMAAEERRIYRDLKALGLQSTRTDIECPNCNERFENSTCATGHARKAGPQAGDLVLCASCTMPFTIDQENGKPRALTGEEMETFTAVLDNDPRADALMAYLRVLTGRR